MAVNDDKISFRHIRDVEDGVLNQFSCGRSQLDEFLHKDARNYDWHGLTSTVVVFHADLPFPIGYFSLTADSVHLSGGERDDLGLPFYVPISYYPAVKLTKLAVADAIQSKGIGEYLINSICGIAASAPFAVRLITVDAVNQERVLSFYQRVGFMESLSKKREHGPRKPRETILMFKDLFQ